MKTRTNKKKKYLKIKIKTKTKTKTTKQKHLFRQKGGQGLFANASYYLNQVLLPSKNLLPFEGHYS